MEGCTMSFRQLKIWLDKNRDTNEHIFKHKQTPIMSWGCFKQADRPQSCFVVDDEDNIGREPEWY